VKYFVTLHFNSMRATPHRLWFETNNTKTASYSIMDNLHTMTEQVTTPEKLERIGVFCSSSGRMEQVYYDEARRLGLWLGSHGKTLVYGGSRCGMMEVLAKAVKESGGKVFGVVPQKVLKNNMVSDQIDITFYADGLSDRKDWLIGESDIMVVLPGSVGTLDEAFSAMASHTFGEHQKNIIFYNVNGFWDDLFVMLDNLEKKGVVNKPFNQFVLRASSLEELTAMIEG